MMDHPKAMEGTNDAILPVRVDETAKSDPERIWAEFPAAFSSYDHGFRPVRYKELANAVNGAAWWLLRNVGEAKNFETINYVGPNDLRYPIIVLGAVKAGYKVLSILKSIGAFMTEIVRRYF